MQWQGLPKYSWLIREVLTFLLKLPQFYSSCIQDVRFYFGRLYIFLLDFQYIPTCVHHHNHYFQYFASWYLIWTLQTRIFPLFQSSTYKCVLSHFLRSLIISVICEIFVSFKISSFIWQKGGSMQLQQQSRRRSWKVATATLWLATVLWHYINGTWFQIKNS